VENELAGKKVAVLVETEYIHDEITFYEKYFTSLGAQVDFITYLFGKPERTIICDITDTENPAEHIHTMKVYKDFDECNPNDYSIILVGANYVACRLREIMPMGSLSNVDKLRTPPAVRFFASAMMNPNIVKGALCHGLWLLTPVPELLKGRRVICHTVVLADIYNAGGVYVPDPSHVVVDEDLVTARSAQDLEIYAENIMKTYRNLIEKKETI
jgi:protease I